MITKAIDLAVTGACKALMWLFPYPEWPIQPVGGDHLDPPPYSNFRGRSLDEGRASLMQRTARHNVAVLERSLVRGYVGSIGYEAVKQALHDDE